MKPRRFFSLHWIVCIWILCIPWVVSACHQSFDSPTPVSTVTQPTPESAKLSPIVIPEVSSSPTFALTPTPIPTLEKTSPVNHSVCLDGMEILASFGSISGDESGVLVAWPGKQYNLSWRILNSGTCIWDSAYSLERESNDQNAVIGGNAPVMLKERISPGNSVVVQFNIVAPLSPGDYPVRWMLLNGFHRTVGQALLAVIRIPADSQNRPLSTLTKNPNVQFEASSTKVAPYDRVILSWDVKKAKAVYFYPAGQAWISNQAPLKGVRIFYPTKDTAFNLRVVNINYVAESYKIEVIVEPPFGLPDIVDFELVPKGKVIIGDCVDITWRVRGGMATDVSLFANDIPLVTSVDRIGEYTDCPVQVGLQIYTLIASGPAGSVCKTKTINVLP